MKLVTSLVRQVQRNLAIAAAMLVIGVPLAATGVRISADAAEPAGEWELEETLALRRQPGESRRGQGGDVVRLVRPVSQAGCAASRAATGRMTGSSRRIAGGEHGLRNGCGTPLLR
jgi:hypothetical protein